MNNELKCPDGIPFTEVRLLNIEDCFTEDLSTTLKPEQGFVDFTFCFKDGTSATFKDAGSLQEFLDRLAKFHELEQQLIQAKQDLEQSEKCCSAWEIQALDYKAETIALSGKLEIARKALNLAKWWLGSSCIATAEKTIDKALEQIEYKE